MSKNKRKKNTKKNTRRLTPVLRQQVSAIDPFLNELAEIAAKRTGGSVSIQGFLFQFKYAAWRLLDYFSHQDKAQAGYIRLEGVDDLDFIEMTDTGVDVEFTQVKYSKNKMDAGRFWALGVL